MAKSTKKSSKKGKSKAKSKKKTGSRKVRKFQQEELAGKAVCVRSTLILQYTHETVEAQLKAHDLARKDRAALISKERAKRPSKRKSKRVGTLVGMTTDEEQDILRAMLVMASAGLDSMLKQLILDALPTVISNNSLSQSYFAEFLQRKLKRELDADPTKVDFLAGLLSGRNPRDIAIARLVEELRQGSLQSTDGISKAAAAFGVTAEAGIDLQQLRSTFDVRNQIVHELDINFDNPRRNRNLRNKSAMIEHSNLLLGTAEKFLIAVETSLP